MLLRPAALGRRLRGRRLRRRPPPSVPSSGGSAADEALGLLPALVTARDVGRMAKLRDELISVLNDRRHRPEPLPACERAGGLGPAANANEVMAAALAQAEAEEQAAAEDDPDAAVAGIDALGSGVAASLGRVLHALTGVPVPSVDEVAALEEAAAAPFAPTAWPADPSSPLNPRIDPPAAVHRRRGMEAAASAFGKEGGGSASIERLLAWDGAPHTRRQRLLRELGGLQVLMRLILETLPDASADLDVLADIAAPLPGLGGPVDSPHRAADAHLARGSADVPSPFARRLARLAYGVLELACREQPASQLALAPWLPHMLAHVPLNVGAQSTVASLLDANRALLEHTVSGDLLRLIRSMLLRHGHRPELLRFLRMLCVCQGVALESHQISVCELIWREGATDSGAGTDEVGGSAAEGGAVLMTMRAAGEADGEAVASLPWQARRAHAAAAEASSSSSSSAKSDSGLGAAEGAAGDAYMAQLVAAEDVPSAGLLPVELSWMQMAHAPRRCSPLARPVHRFAAADAAAHATPGDEDVRQARSSDASTPFACTGRSGTTRVPSRCDRSPCPSARPPALSPPFSHLLPPYLPPPPRPLPPTSPPRVTRVLPACPTTPPHVGTLPPLRTRCTPGSRAYPRGHPTPPRQRGPTSDAAPSHPTAVGAELVAHLSEQLLLAAARRATTASPPAAALPSEAPHGRACGASDPSSRRVFRGSAE